MAKEQTLETNLQADFWYKFLRFVMFALLMMPLLVWSIFLFPFITTKILYWRILVELALLIYIPLAIKYPQLRPRWDALTKLVWLYLGVVFLTSIFGVDFGSSFWGTIERGEGIITLLHFVFYFTILSAALRTPQDWQRYFLLAITITLVVGLYGLGQLWNLPFVIHAGASRISGTIGNASFFAAFLLFGIFLSLYLLQKRELSKTKRWYLWVVVILELILLFESRTRGALLATFLVFLIYLLFQAFKGNQKKIKVASALALLLLIVSAFVIYLNRDKQWVKANNTLLRLTSISLGDVTTQSRLDTWQASWKGWKERFFLGQGYENYHIAFNKHFPARIFKDQGSQIWFDRAHNMIFDVAVNSGLLGLLTYLGIFVAAFLTLFRLYQRPPSGFSWQEPALLLVLLLTYFLQNLFVFDTPATYLMIFMFLAYLVFLKAHYLKAGDRGQSRGYEVGYILPTILVILFVLVQYFVNFEPAFANYYTTQGIKMAKLEAFRQVRPPFQQALAYGTYMDEEIRQRLVDYSLEAIKSGQLSPVERNELYQYLVAELKKSIKDSPLDAKHYLYLMSVHNRLGGAAQLPETFALGAKALELSPTRPQIYFELGQAAFAAEDFEKGLDYFRAAIELNPEPKESHFNYLLAAIIAGRKEIAQQEEILLEEQGYAFLLPDYLSLARAYFQGGQKEKVIEMYQKALELDPKSLDLHLKLAASYGEICDLANARLQVAQATTINQSVILEGQQFLRELEEKCKK